MSNWTHTLTVIVPESIMAQANQLALAIGTSNYAVAHTQAVEQIMGYFAQVPVELASSVAFPTISISTEGITTLSGSDMTKIQVFMDCEPFAVFSLLNLTRRDVAEIEVQ